MKHVGCFGDSYFDVFCYILCLETMVNEKGEAVFSVDSCLLAKDLQGPQGTTTHKVGLVNTCCRFACRFSDGILGQMFAICGPHFGALLRPN